MRANGSMSRIARIAWRPVMIGSCKSITVTSGRWRVNCSTASLPLLASATTVMSGCTVMIRASPSRSRRWSSTTSRRMGAVMLGASLHRKRHCRLDRRATIRGADDGELAPQPLGAFAHAEKPQVLARRRPVVQVGDEALAVVLDPQHDAGGLGAQRQAHLRGVP